MPHPRAKAPRGPAFQVDREESVDGLARRVGTALLDAFEHQSVGREGLLREIDAPRPSPTTLNGEEIP